MPDDPMCVFHGKALELINTKLDALAGQQAGTTATIDGLRREMEAGFRWIGGKQDATNGRVTGLEAASGKLQADSAAQQHFDVASTSDRRDIWNAINKLRESESGLHETIKHHEGYVGGAARVGNILWVLLVALVGLIGWLLGLWLRSHQG
jgi:hypothetical protein